MALGGKQFKQETREVRMRPRRLVKIIEGVDGETLCRVVAPQLPQDQAESQLRQSAILIHHAIMHADESMCVRTGVHGRSQVDRRALRIRLWGRSVEPSY